jgi:hypothetical protein
MAHPSERLANLDRRSVGTAKDNAELAAKGPRLPGVIMTPSYLHNINSYSNHALRFQCDESVPRVAEFIKQEDMYV